MIEISDIIISVQNKDYFVLDEFVRQGEFLRTKSGQLQRYVGGFTAVFPVVVKHEKWAFRCWHADLGNVRRRFLMIAKAIKESKARYLCDFAYVDEGIAINGKKYPTTRMRWVDGYTLKDYICENANDATKLNALAKHFFDLVRDMHSHGFAHGDLQHGNIIVDKHGEIYLVDYDSFYCQELKGESDIITGLDDYQHPSRKRNVFANEKLDYFSELIIYLSILAIAEKPSLSAKYNVPDSERMLFSASDYQDITHAAVYNDLQALGPTIRQLLNVLCIYLSKATLDDLEPFDVVIDRLTQLPEIHSFCAASDACLKGDAVQLSWDIENYTQVLLNGKDVTADTHIEEIADLQTTYTLEVVNYQKRISESIHISIFPRPVISFCTDKKKLHKDKMEIVTLTWNVQNAEQCSLIAPDGTNENCEPQGAATITPAETCTYILRTRALDKRTTIDTPITISVYPDAQVEFASDKGYIFPSIPFTLSWKVRYAKRVTLNGKLVKATDTITYDSGIEKDTTYVLRVTDEFGEKDYYLTIKMLPIPQINTILVPTPHINENITITTNVPTPTLNIRFPQPRLQSVELLDMNKYDVHVETNIVPPIHLIIPRFELKEQSLFERIYNKLNKILKHNGNEIK